LRQLSSTALDVTVFKNEARWLGVVPAGRAAIQTAALEAPNQRPVGSKSRVPYRSPERRAADRVLIPASTRRFSARNLREFAVALRLRELEIGVAFVGAVVHVLRAFDRSEAEVAKFQPALALPESPSSVPE
jgi:hypothetical protein